MNDRQHDRGHDRNRRGNRPPLYTPIGVDRELEDRVRGLLRIIRADAMNRYVITGTDIISQRLRLGDAQLLDVFKTTVAEIYELWARRPTAAMIQEALRSESDNRAEAGSSGPAEEILSPSPNPVNPEPTTDEEDGPV